MKNPFFSQRSAQALLFAGLLGLAPNCAWAAPSTTRVSVATDGTQGDMGSYEPSISADGRFAAFDSNASNLVADDTNGRIDVFVRDRQSGTTTRVSVATDGTQGNMGSYEPSISGDGRFVAFQSYSSNLVADDTNGQPDIFVRDLQSGTTTRVSVATDGVQANDISQSPSISADGRFVAFHSNASNLVTGDTNDQTDVFVRDRQSGTTTRVSVATNGTQANALCAAPSISADGRFVAFQSNASNLVTGDTNVQGGVFVRDLQTNTTTMVSVATDGTPANALCAFSSISADGRFVAFQSDSTNLVADDTNFTYDIFVRDLQSGTTTRVSVATDGVQANDISQSPSISADGRFVAFHSNASNLMAGDTNGTYDVFVRDLKINTTTRVSVATNGTQGDALSYSPKISADGRTIAFVSDVSNLVANDTNGATDIFVRDSGSVGVAAAGHTFSYAPSADFSAAVKTNLPGVTLTLKNSEGTVVATTTSDASGSYHFAGLAAGQYTVTAKLVRAGQPTLILSPASRPITVEATDVAVSDFKLFSIFGLAKAPLLDGTTGPQKNVVVTLKNAEGTVVGTRTTIEDGRFSFGKLAAGTYKFSAAKTGFSFPNAPGLVLPGAAAPFAPALKKNLIGTRNPSAPVAGRSGATF